MSAAETVRRTVHIVHSPAESHAAIEKYRRVSDEKLYGDNDLVDDKHLARHCIGLSGIQFSDAEIEDLAERIREMKKKGTLICCLLDSDGEAGETFKRCRTGQDQS